MDAVWKKGITKEENLGKYGREDQKVATKRSEKRNTEDKRIKLLPDKVYFPAGYFYRCPVLIYQRQRADGKFYGKACLAGIYPGTFYLVYFYGHYDIPSDSQ